MMALSTFRDPTVTLTDYTNYTPWLNQFQTRCQFLKVWSVINPALTDEPKQARAMLVPPLIGNYQSSAAYATANSKNLISTGILAIVLSQSQCLQSATYFPPFFSSSGCIPYSTTLLFSTNLPPCAANMPVGQTRQIR